MGHNNLASYFNNQFALAQHHKWSITELESMMPWEKYIYIDLLQQFIKEEQDRLRDLEVERKSQMSTLNRRRM